MTVGPVGGADPEAVDDSDLIISWGADLVATNVHFWARVEAAQKRGVKLVVIDPRRSRTGRGADCLSADPHRHRRGAGARHHAHPGARRAGRPRLCRRAHDRVRPARGRGAAAVSRPTQSPRSPVLQAIDIEGLAAHVRRGKALVHPPGRGHDPAGARRRGVARGGAVARRHRRLWPARRRRAAADRGVVRARLRGAAASPPGPADDAHGQSSAARRCAAQHDRPADPRALRRRQQSGGHLSRRRQGAAGPRCARICSPSCTTRS